MVAESSPIRALSWNVHGFVGRSGRRDPAAVMRAIRALDADIVSLQEIDDRRRAPGDAASFVTLGEAFDRYSTAARTIRSPDGDYGHVLMSCWPMRGNRYLDLSVGRREPRMAISCTVDTPNGPIRVVSAHLGLSARERRRQVAIIARHLRSVDTAAIVMGDFNEWRRRGVATRALCPPFELAAGLPSFPARRPVFALDRIWSRAPLEPLAASVATEYRDLSDHLGVLADFRFESAARGPRPDRGAPAEPGGPTAGP